MTDIYSDLENYNDVNIVNELKNENAELKIKLGECISSMESLQKDFDKLSAEFKTLEKNYSSLLGIARAEIKRKTDMITNLNIEKDRLVISQFRNDPGSRQRMLNVNNAKPEGKQKTYQNRSGPGQKQKTELTRKQSEPSECSSTTTEKSNISSSIEHKPLDTAKATSRSVSIKESDVNRNMMLPDPRERNCDERPQMQKVLDRRLPAFASRPKLSSDEEFEDMYYALGPKTPPEGSSLREELERGRKRFREEPRLERPPYDKFDSQERLPKHPEPYRERYNHKRNKYYEGDRNINRDKYDLLHSQRNKYSPDRHRRGKREYFDERYAHQYDRHRRLESPPKERYQNRSREFRSFPDRERSDSKSDSHRYSHPDSLAAKHKTHGEYDEPQVKRFRTDQYSNLDDNMRHIDRRLSSEHRLVENTDFISCQSPDYLYAEHMPSNEPIREIRFTAVAKLDDPRVNCPQYIKRSYSNNDTYTARSSKICLKRIDAARWELPKHEAPSALLCQPPQVSDDLVNEIYMDIDKFPSNMAVDSNDVNDVTDDLDAHKNSGMQGQHVIVKIDLPTTVKNAIHTKEVVNVKETSDRMPELNKQTNSELRSISAKKSDELSSDKNLQVEQPEIKSNTNSEQNNAPTSIVSNKNSHTNDSDDNPNRHNNNPQTESVQPELEHKVCEKHIVEGDLELSDETNDETEVQDSEDRLRTKKKHKSKRKSHRDTSKEKKIDLALQTRKTRLKKDKDKEVKETKSDKDKEVKEIKKDKEVKERTLDKNKVVTETKLDKDKEIKETKLDKDTEVMQTKLDKDKEIKEPKKDKNKEVKETKKDKKKEIKDSKKDRSKEMKCAKKDQDKVVIETKLDIDEGVKGKDFKPKNKFTELFGDSSSLITPEDLELATIEVHTQPADTYELVCENAQDGTNLKEKQSEAHIPPPQNEIGKPNENSILHSNSALKTLLEENTNKTKPTKETKSRTHSKGKKGDNSTELSAGPDESVKDAKDVIVSNDVTQTVVDSNEGFLTIPDVSKPDKKTKGALKCIEKPKESSKLIKHLKSDEEKSHLISNESMKKTINDEIDVSTAESKKTQEGSNDNMDNKENTTCVNNSTPATNSDMANIFDDTLIPNKDIQGNSDVNVVKVLENGNSKEIKDNGFDEIPNLVTATEDTGLVNTIVISTGVQPSHPDLLRFNTTDSHNATAKTLVTSTPAKEVSTPNTQSDIEPNTKQPANCVSVKVANENIASQNESDVPDVRINVYRRRRKVLKS